MLLLSPARRRHVFVPLSLTRCLLSPDTWRGPPGQRGRRVSPRVRIRVAACTPVRRPFHHPRCGALKLAPFLFLHPQAAQTAAFPAPAAAARPAASEPAATPAAVPEPPTPAESAAPDASPSAASRCVEWQAVCRTRIRFVMLLRFLACDPCVLN
jgi:hypothetical protein